VWNKVPEEAVEAILELALAEPALSPRELAVKYTDTVTTWPGAIIASSRNV